MNTPIKNPDKLTSQLHADHHADKENRMDKRDSTRTAPERLLRVRNRKTRSHLARKHLVALNGLKSEVIQQSIDGQLSPEEVVDRYNYFWHLEQSIRHIVDATSEELDAIVVTLEQLRQAAHYRQVLNEGNGHRTEVLRKIQKSRYRDFLIGAIARSYEDEETLSREMLSA